MRTPGQAGAQLQAAIPAITSARSNRSRPSCVSNHMRALAVRVLAPLPVTALAALTLAGCASSSRLAPAACTPGDLRVTAAFSQGSTQHGIYDLGFANVSRTACTLQGFPGVSLVTAGNSSGRPIGSPRPLLLRSAAPAATVTLAPGQRALALLGVAETVLFTGSSCAPVVAHWLRIYPPHASHAVYVPINAVTCSSSPDQVLEISPVFPDSRTAAPAEPAGNSQPKSGLPRSLTT
jgi:Protein of unknown function (DUF4232)